MGVLSYSWLHMSHSNCFEAHKLKQFGTHIKVLNHKHTLVSRFISIGKNEDFTPLHKLALPFTSNQYWIKGMHSGKMSKFEYSIGIAACISHVCLIKQ